MNFSREIELRVLKLESIMGKNLTPNERERLRVNLREWCEKDMKEGSDLAEEQFHGLGEFGI